MIRQTDRKKRGKAARNKGKNAELELSHILTDSGIPCHRGKVFYHESDIVGIPGIHPEVKRQESLNLWKAMQQAEEEAAIRNDGAPTVFFRRDRSGWMVCMKLDDWIRLYKGGGTDG